MENHSNLKKVYLNLTLRDRNLTSTTIGAFRYCGQQLSSNLYLFLTHYWLATSSNNGTQPVYEAFHVNCPSPRRASPKSCNFELMFMILKITLKNCLISVFDVFFPQLSNDVGISFEIFYFHLQKLFRILFLAKNISGTL